ncbi:hypothetical protein HYC85_025134 [Camellia sinensis]|uniref:Uncharacterized protein n=1 Tax=Camellia sinensis TaxID=4442 RepID=A0A7J7GDW4_CAMSI|nr:hypothetical protein HYC85_025134 [Camellia sinensis]
MTPKGQRFNSFWVHFDRMDLIEKGLNSVSIMVYSSPMDEDEHDGDDDEKDLYQSVKRGVIENRDAHRSTSNGIGGCYSGSWGCRQMGIAEEGVAEAGNGYDGRAG